MASIVAGQRVGPKPGRLPPGALVFRRRLLAWYARHRRRLPWRGARDPYAVLVSETMLQQTQVARVLEFYPRFLARYPTLEDLAAASADAVRESWDGLGYYARARRPRCQDCPVWGSCATGRTRADREKETREGGEDEVVHRSYRLAWSLHPLGGARGQPPRGRGKLDRRRPRELGADAHPRLRVDTLHAEVADGARQSSAGAHGAGRDAAGAHSDGVGAEA